MVQKLSITVGLNVLYSSRTGIIWTHDWKASICPMCFIFKTAGQILGNIVGGLGCTSTSDVNIIVVNNIKVWKQMS